MEEGLPVCREMSCSFLSHSRLFFCYFMEAKGASGLDMFGHSGLGRQDRVVT